MLFLEWQLKFTGFEEKQHFIIDLLSNTKEKGFGMFCTSKTFIQQ